MHGRRVGLEVTELLLLLGIQPPLTTSLFWRHVKAAVLVGHAEGLANRCHHLHMQKPLLLLSLLLTTASTARASIYADLFAGTVTGRNDGLADVVITNGDETMRTVAEAAKSPPGTKGLKPHQKLTVPMNRAGFRFYSDEFARLKRQGIEAIRNKAELERNAREWDEQQKERKNRQRENRRRALENVADGLKDFAESLEKRNPRSCTTNFIGNTAYTNCN